MRIDIKTFEDMNFTGDTDNEVYYDDVSVTYLQDGDCTEDRDEPQEIKFTTRNNGVARFVNIETKNWSLNDAEEFVEIFNDFCKRAGIKMKDEKDGKEKSK